MHFQTLIRVEILSAPTTVIARLLLKSNINAFVKKIAHHTKNRFAVQMVAPSITYVCYKKTYAQIVQIIPSIILEAAQVN